MKTFGLYLWVAFAALFISGKPLAQVNNEVYENACAGGVQDSLAVLEQYFAQYNPRRAELKPDAAANYLAHHGIIDGEISVFVFASQLFPSYAVVAAKKTGPDAIWCIVRINGRVHKEYSVQALEVILKSKDGSV